MLYSDQWKRTENVNEKCDVRFFVSCLYQSKMKRGYCKIILTIEEKIRI